MQWLTALQSLDLREVKPDSNLAAIIEAARTNLTALRVPELSDGEFCKLKEWAPNVTSLTALRPLPGVLFAACFFCCVREVHAFFLVPECL